LIDVICESGAKVFVCAVGVPPKWAVDKLHAAGILCMNMIGAPKHVPKALAVGVDIICAQGGEGGGHTGDVPTSVLIPTVVDLCKGKLSPLTGRQVSVVAAGGIYDGRGLAMALAFGADAVWVGTRFVAAEEAGAPARHQKGVTGAGFHDTIRTIIYSGRPMRVLKNEMNVDWEANRQADIKMMTEQGRLPYELAFEEMSEEMKDKDGNIDASAAMRKQIELTPMLMGNAAGAIKSVEPAKKIIDDMVSGAIGCLRAAHGTIARL
jgi:NAD(P)H-dependent flavin oxidoreductase YrpB (nitropropane dioxygenase family)